MARRLVIGLATAFVAWTAVADNFPSLAASPTGWSSPKSFTRGGLTLFYPRAWHAGTEGNMVLVYSGSRAPALSTNGLHPVPDGEAWIWLVDLGQVGRADGFPKRPDEFRLLDRDKAFQSCGFGFEGWNLTFTDEGHTIQAVVGLGAGAAKADATRVLDRLGVAG